MNTHLQIRYQPVFFCPVPGPVRKAPGQEKEGLETGTTEKIFIQESEQIPVFMTRKPGSVLL